jgi:glycosyltransferase involved in cell wall biosynthesis
MSSAATDSPVVGLEFDQRLREMWSEQFGSRRPLASEFVEWIETIPEYSATGLPRYLQAVYDTRTDVQAMYPEVRSGILNRFAWWVGSTGRAEHPNIRLLGHSVPADRYVPDQGREIEGVDVTGFFTTESGIGEAGRTTVSALRTAGVDVSTINYTDTLSRTSHPFTVDDVSRHRTVLLSVNADHLPTMRERMGDHFLRDRYVIGQWFWELETAPSWYAEAFKIIDELWAPTRFIERMLRDAAPSRVMVTHVPLPITVPEVDSTVSRGDVGLDDRFTFLFVFDFLSVMKRKNPLGLIDAFCRAFTPGEGPHLVIKTINGNRRLKDLNQLLAASSLRPDITVMDSYLPRTHTSALMSLADCYVSLHRSEGLGLTMSESMSLGTPVIATGYSGNLDFMDDSNSWLVSSTRVAVGDSAEGYDPQAMWAEPDLDEAARIMRHVWTYQDEARQKGAIARDTILERHTPAVSGAIMKNRLMQIWSEQRGR